VLLCGKKTDNVTLRHFRELLLPWESKNYYILSVCVCARASLLVRSYSYVCGCPEALAYSCTCVRIALLIQHATRVRHIVMSFMAYVSTTFFDIISKTARFSKKK
jgi:hypothetical protein